jgi:hypothetical protein
MSRTASRRGDVADVSLGGCLGDDQLARDGAVTQSSRYQRSDLAFTSRERPSPIGR